MSAHTIFISDLHLQQSEPEKVNQFVRFLQNITPDTDAIYILGDFFEVWIGDDDNAPVNKKIIDALRQCVIKNIPIYCMHGNRDFLLGEEFVKQSGCTLISDPALIDLYGRPTLLSHGDMFCTNDKLFMIVRHMLRSKTFANIYLSLPLWLRRLLAKGMRTISKNRKLNNKNIIGINQNAIISTMQNNKAMQLIHGHIHRYTVKTSMLDANDSRIISLGAWENKPSILTYYSDHTLQNT